MGQLLFIPLDKLTKMARTVPENILKKQARDKVLQDATIKRRAEAKAKRVESRKTFAANAEKYANEYAATEAATIKAKRDAKKAGNFYVEPEAKIAFVIRTRGINKLAPKPKKIMHLLRLRQLHNGVFQTPKSHYQHDQNGRAFRHLRIPLQVHRPASRLQERLR